MPDFFRKSSFISYHSISFEQLQDPWAAAQIDQVDARCDNAAADQHADHAKPQHGIEDNDDAEDGQQSAEDQRDPPVGAEHFTEAKPVGFFLELAQVESVDDSDDAKGQDPPARQQDHKHADRHLQYRREHKHKAKDQRYNCARQHPCTLPHDTLDIEPSNNTPDTVSNHDDSQNKGDHSGCLYRREEAIHANDNHQRAKEYR